MTKPRHSAEIAPHPAAKIPPDDLNRKLTMVRPNVDTNLRHIAQVGATDTILLTGADTNGRYCLIDILVFPGGGPPLHRHDFEETFTVLEGEIEITFRDETFVFKTGETVHIPANAPHRFHNQTERDARLLCLCSPAGLEEFLMVLGVPVATRTTRPPQSDPAGEAAFKAKAERLAPEYRTELL